MVQYSTVRTSILLIFGFLFFVFSHREVLHREGGREGVRNTAMM